MTNTFETTSRKLEQFLFLHGIRYESFHKNDDGMTAWVYRRTDELDRVVSEYRDVLAKTNSAVWGLAR